MSRAPDLAARPTAPPVLLVGNPNVGKSVIFGALTRTYVTVANYPGTTVEITRGRALSLPGAPDVIDAPGTNSLTPQSDDERVARDLLLAEPDAVVLQVGDTKNLRRVLYLTAQLGELGRRQLLVLNLQDEALDLGVRVEASELERRLGVPVIPATATRNQGLDAIPGRLHQATVARLECAYPGVVERAALEVAALLPEELGNARRGVALMLLSGDRGFAQLPHCTLPEGAAELVERRRRELERALGTSAATAIARARQRAVVELLQQVFHVQRGRGVTLRDRLGDLSMHPIWGVPVLLAVLFLAYEFVGVFGAGTLVRLVEDGLFGKVINPAATALAGRVLPWEWARSLFVGPYGVVTMALTYAIAIVLPVVGTFFVLFGVLEDSGYLPRLAVMLNRIFRGMGLNGKAVLPMILGLGCDTMATLTTRILPTRKERVLVTLLLALGVPCSAQLGVVLAMLGSMAPAGTLIWGGVVAGTLFGVGWAAARLVPGKGSQFLLEVPPMRVPSLANILVKTVARTEWYLKEALPLFVLGTLLLFVLDVTAILPRLEALARPLVVGLLGLPAQATDAFLVGFLRRDYGAAGFFVLRRGGELDGVQSVVALTVITLFVPCIANFFVMIKERGLKVTLAMVAFIVPFAFAVGAALNWALRSLGVHL
ncbi:MAG: ferrous iron transport protein B [Acidobacteria bacterium RBG_13_68_16]|jgi:ferrous iron transport protein B|nr:MAG: ferrous iron transport protein B [Acidobacteria bacterium RBG_13_68_16]